MQGTPECKRRFRQRERERESEKIRLCKSGTKAAFEECFISPFFGIRFDYSSGSISLSGKATGTDDDTMNNKNKKRGLYIFSQERKEARLWKREEKVH